MTNQPYAIKIKYTECILKTNTYNKKHVISCKQVQRV